jgi:signal-transduction protein with cAMP-binding, CBS, and nucleotidyltransferase domain
MPLAHMPFMRPAHAATVQPQCTLKEGAEVLARRCVNALFVSGKEGEILGILSQRDIIHAVGRRGAAALEEAVSLHMTSDCPKPDISDYAAMFADLSNEMDRSG